MHKTEWQLQDAKTQFSQVVEAAMHGQPQHITKHGKRAVVVLSEQAFDSLQRNAQAAAPGFIAHLLGLPKIEEAIERVPLNLRDIDLT